MAALKRGSMQPYGCFTRACQKADFVEDRLLPRRDAIPIMFCAAIVCDSLFKSECVRIYCKGAGIATLIAFPDFPTSSGFRRDYNDTRPAVIARSPDFVADRRVPNNSGRRSNPILCK